MSSEQQLATTPPVIHVSPDDITSKPRTHTWVFGGTKSGKVISSFWAYIDEVVAQSQHAAQQEAQRNTAWSVLLGRPLSPEEASAVHEAARKLSTVTAMSYTDAAEYILGLMHRMRIVTVDYATSPAWSGIMYVQPQGTPQEHWWEGLEHVRTRYSKVHARASMSIPNTRGRYHYGSIKACSYWRHTRTR